MTVKELMEKLQNFQEDAEVMISTKECGYGTAPSVIYKKICSIKTDYVYATPYNFKTMVLIEQQDE